MNRSDTEQKNASGAVVSNAANTRLTGPWLAIARAVWLALVIPSLGFCIASLLVSYQQLQSGAFPAQEQQVLSAIGLSVSGFNTLNIIFNVITSAIWYGVGFLIFWRRSDDWLALLAAFVLVMFNVTFNSNNNVPSTLASVYPALTLPLNLMNFLGGISLGVFFLLFPNGRLVPRWMRLILLLLIISEFLGDFPSPSSAFDANWPGWLLLLMTLVTYGAIIYSQIYRYQRMSRCGYARAKMRENQIPRSNECTAGLWVDEPFPGHSSLSSHLSHLRSSDLYSAIPGHFAPQACIISKCIQMRKMPPYLSHLNARKY